jgi:hypothetical protein
MSKKPVCPNCNSTVERRGKDYYCPSCNLLFNNPTKKSQEDLTEELEMSSGEIGKLKTKFKVLGGLMALSGVVFLFASTLSVLFVSLAIFYLLLGAYLIF